jgi:hypothetical protein
MTLHLQHIATAIFFLPKIQILSSGDLPEAKSVLHSPMTYLPLSWCHRPRTNKGDLKPLDRDIIPVG